MTIPSDLPLEHERNYGIPARTPASTALWARLLQKDTLGSPSNSGFIIPPITPLDKNGTSMRILLHDTQAQLDKFSCRVDKLCSGVDQTKHEISMVNTLFQREHENLTGELVDLVNRSQMQLQTSIGTPAQADQLGRLSKDINTHLEALDKRIDAIQLFNQTHSQTLQLQSQALQTLQDQHGTVIAALMPLLPLLQAIPLHIDSARNNLAETIRKGSSIGGLGSPRRTQDRPHAIDCNNGHKRSSSNFHSDNSPSSLTNKRPRLTTNKDSDAMVEPTEPGITDRDLLTEPIQTKLDLAILSKSTYVPNAPTRSSSARHETIVIRSARPLDPANPFDEPKCHTPSRQTSTPPSGRQDATDSPARPDGEAASIASSSPRLSQGDTPSAQRPPRILRVHSISSKTGADTHPTLAAVHENGLLTFPPASKIRAVPMAKNTVPSTPRHDKLANHFSAIGGQNQEKDRTPQRSRLSTPSVSSRLPLMFRPLNPPNTQLGGKNLSPMLPPGHGQRSTQGSRTSTPSFSAPRPPIRGALVPKNTVSAQHISLLPSSQLRLPLHGSSTVLPAPQRQSESTIASNVPIGTMPSVQDPPPAVKVRERRSPFRSGRRFIPLGDSEDDDDDDGGG